MGVLISMIVSMLLAAPPPAQKPPRAAPAAGPKGPAFTASAGRAMNALLGVWYAGNGQWRACNSAGCPTGDHDWGYDSLTYTLALRYNETHDQNLVPLLSALAAAAPTYQAPCQQVAGCGTHSLSDTPMWDTVALADEYLATHDPAALSKAEAAFNFVAGARVFGIGACPAIPYQKPGGGDTRLKTLETEANAIKAAILLYEATSNSSYLTDAVNAYSAAQHYFLDPSVPLYTVYVFDDGHGCTQLPHRFFGSVNGDMIWAGSELYHITGQQPYLDQAIATAHALAHYLADARGVYADLQAENDVVEPLVEGMNALAARGDAVARSWLTSNASAALAARTPDGSFGRFFDGPPPSTEVTAWQTNGGLALQIAAAARSPGGHAGVVHGWRSGRLVQQDVSSLPSSLTFRGSGIALLGTIGEQCCTHGHARVLVDGQETFDGSGIWQNKANFHQSIPGSVLFAWRWRGRGRHTVTLLPGVANAKEGGSYLHLVGYQVLSG